MQLDEFNLVKNAIREQNMAYYPEDVIVGDFTYGNPFIEAEGEGAVLKIGKFCAISHDVTIMLGGNHRVDWNSTYPFNVLMPSFSGIKGHPSTKGDVIIGNDVWIGSGVKILSGVTIGDGSVIGTNALVTKDVAPYSVVGGIPAKSIKRRFPDEIIRQLCEMKWWDWEDKHIVEVIPLLQSNNFEALREYYINHVKNSVKIQDRTTIVKKIQEYINSEEYEKAGKLMKEWKAETRDYDDTMAILDASICEAVGDKEGMFGAIRNGLRYAHDNYELYYMLGCYYCDSNNDQAYLCFQNALYYCNKEEDRETIISAMRELEASGQVEVKPVAIIIVSYNSCYLMQKNIASIRETLLEGSYHIVVVDNASDDGVAEWLEEQEDVVLIRNTANMGFPKACNLGVKMTKGTEAEDDDIFLLNNDTRLAPNALFWLRMGLYENEKVGATGSYSNYAGNEQQIEVTFSLPGEYLAYGAKRNLPERFPYEERVRLSGFAMLIRGNVWEETGGFDEAFSPGYFEDDDLSMKIQRLGYRLLLCKNSFIYHAGSQSFSKYEKLEETLLGHHELFRKKYGFDILEYAYADIESVLEIPFSEEDEFNLLQIGSGLSADLKFISTRFPKAHVIGVETNPNIYQIAKNTNVVFPDIAALKVAFNRPAFHVLFIRPEEYANITREDLHLISSLCRKDCLIIPRINNAGENNRGVVPGSGEVVLEKIKLVIWDLDQTFWNGILSEGEITPVEGREALLKGFTDCGIINSISSKNEREKVMEILKKWELEEYFVFPDINWQDKGEQIRKKLHNMGLRAENVLFIDDDSRNLEEARYCNPGIMTGGPEIIPFLEDYVRKMDKIDAGHKRLAEYRVLETKHRERENFNSREDFLFYSGIQVEVKNDCLEELDRITELVARTNQLNYTKVRDSRERLESMLSNRLCNKGYVKVKDRFGEYGIVGFYCFEEGNCKLRHFLFSCRTLGMGIEQYIYSMLGAPELNVVLPVAVELKSGAEIPWIQMVNSEKENRNVQNISQETKDNRVKILFKGPCDLSAIESYLSGGNLVTEFNYVNDKGFITTGQNHSMHIWESAVYSKKQIEEILEEVPFLTWGDFQTRLFTEEYHVICYSLLPDCHAGLYRNKKTGAYISFGSRNFDLTAPGNKAGYIDGSIVNHAFPFTEEIIEQFSENWKFVGMTSGDDLIRNLDYIYNHVLGNPVIILFLGSEIEYEGINEEFADHAVHHKEVNDLVKEYAADKERIRIIEMTNFIKSQADYEDSINHFSRNVYYDLATAVCSCINGIKR